jgi:hypothetical protein
MWRRALVVVCVALLWPSASLAATSESWHTLRARSAGIRLSVPVTWIDVTRLTPQVAARAKTIPALQAYIEAAGKSNLVKLLAVDVGPATVRTGFANNANVVQTQAVGDLTLLRDATVAQLKGSGIVKGPIRTGFTTLPSGRALTLSYLLRVGSNVVATRQFVLVHGGLATTLTFSARPGALSAATIRRSARSLSFS